MKGETLTQKLHLLWRAGFGPALEQIPTIDKSSIKDLYRSLTKPQKFQPVNFQKPEQPTEDAYNPMDNAEKRKQTQKLNRSQNLDLNIDFMNQMILSEAQLNEKMAFFWHGHFASRSVNPRFSKQLLNSIRRHALGNFKDLLFAVSQSPSMLNFLNNQQNKKGHPNENFAREVMELFTLGRGNYTETDVREGARAFTGWAYNKQGEFIERKNQHDTGEKTFLGKKGNFSGEDVLHIILEKKETARFITEKIYKFFVNEKVDEARVQELSSIFYQANYAIQKLLDSIFLSDWFYEAQHIGNRIKSPIELMVGMMRIMPMQVAHPENLIDYQRLLGQMLLYPPNVAGWPNGKAWIDSSTLMLRLQMPQIWTGLRPMDYDAPLDDDLDMGTKNKNSNLRQFKNPQIEIDWNQVNDTFKGKKLVDYILQSPNKSVQKVATRFADEGIKMNMINLMSTPEYQLM
ncbi:MULTISPECIES: DUF1800 family protein [Sphingobacterium]|uniref:DUF1800 domain-containing protein n=1 Tax=Sphingobacterium tenebrionis TaxID=3111775 RepID=A0ABU8I8W1_9SPHI|nr:DUF1800 domain-containing protein [Sphingobacterium sp. CZ-2]QBR11450.1 DUF1800 domain-containing protein [Sphingobacterium sp. CZ-2]